MTADKHDELTVVAIDIIADVHGNSYTVAVAKIAKRLRIIKADGELAEYAVMLGRSRSRQAHERRMQRRAVLTDMLQDECQRDYTEEHEHGWCGND
jgi:hypothetical protein